jgi:hypothetical protein
MKISIPHVALGAIVCLGSLSLSLAEEVIGVDGISVVDHNALPVVAERALQNRMVTGEVPQATLPEVVTAIDPTATVPPTDVPIEAADTECPVGSQFVDKCFESSMDLVQTDGGKIPPDPIGAAGMSSVIAVTNTEIEARTKDGDLIFGPISLKTMFTGVISGYTPTFVFDPKIIYDTHQDRFVVVVLDYVRTLPNGPRTSSSILVAVSSGNNPTDANAANWYFLKIDSFFVTQGTLSWADYPGIVQSFLIFRSIYYRLVLHLVQTFLFCFSQALQSIKRLCTSPTTCLLLMVLDSKTVCCGSLKSPNSMRE